MLYTTIPTHKLSTESLEDIKKAITDAVSHVSVGGGGGGGSIDVLPIVSAIDELKRELTKESNETQSKLDEIKLIINDLKVLKTASNSTITSIKTVLDSINTKTLTQLQLDTSLSDIETLLAAIKDKPSSASNDYSTQLANLLTQLTAINSNTDGIEAKGDAIKLVMDNTLTTVNNLKTDVSNKLTTIITQTDQIEPKLDTIVGYIDGVEQLLTDIKNKPEYTAILNDLKLKLTSIDNYTFYLIAVSNKLGTLITLLNTPQTFHFKDVTDASDLVADSLKVVASNVFTSFVATANGAGAKITDIDTNSTKDIPIGFTINPGNGLSPSDMSRVKFTGSWSFMWEERSAVNG